MTPDSWAIARWKDIEARELAHSLHVSESKPLGQYGSYTIDPRLHFKAGLIQFGRWPLVHVLQVHHQGRSTYYVYHTAGMSRLLRRNRSLLLRHRWPVETVAFIEHSRHVNAPIQTPLYDVVADAYGDKLNPGRTDVLPKVPRKVLLEAFWKRHGFNDPATTFFPDSAFQDGTIPMPKGREALRLPPPTPVG